MEEEKYVCPKCGEETKKSFIIYACLWAHCPKCDDSFFVRCEVIEDDIVVVNLDVY